MHVLVKHCLAILLFLHGYLNLYPWRWLLINTILSFSNQVPPLLLAITPHPINKETVHVIDITDQLYTLLLWCLVSAFWTFLCVTCWMNSICTCIYIYIHMYVYMYVFVTFILISILVLYNVLLISTDILLVHVYTTYSEFRAIIYIS